jgi:hypothetical protein
MPLITDTVTIPRAGSLSNGVNIVDATILRIITPDDWTPARLSFQIADADVPANYRDVLLFDAGELIITCHPRNVIAIRGSMLFARQCWLKFRSGPSAGPINQAATRVFTIYSEKSSLAAP